MKRLPTPLCSLLTILAILAGCQFSTNNNSNAVIKPLTLKESVREAAQFGKDLHTCFADGAGYDLVKGEIQIVNEKLESLTAKIDGSELSSGDKTKLSNAIDSLLKNYKAIDSKFQGGDELYYTKVEREIYKSLDAMISIANSME